jgi:hypothetical protein
MTCAQSTCHPLMPQPWDMERCLAKPKLHPPSPALLCQLQQVDPRPRMAHPDPKVGPDR